MTVDPEVMKRLLDQGYSVLGSGSRDGVLYYVELCKDGLVAPVERGHQLEALAAGRTTLREILNRHWCDERLKLECIMSLASLQTTLYKYYELMQQSGTKGFAVERLRKQRKVVIAAFEAFETANQAYMDELRMSPADK